MQLWLITLLITFTTVHSRTFIGNFEISLTDDYKPGMLFEMQDRTFQFDSKGSLSMSIKCDKSLNDWGTGLPLNMFLCNENPKTSWLHLYSKWGSCYTSEHQYYHCQIYPMNMTSSTTAEFYHEFTDDQFIVARLRSCPVYTSPYTSYKSVSSTNYLCSYKGVFLNSDQRVKLSMDETWSPLLFQILCVVYGLLCIKALYEICQYHKFHVAMSYIMYLFLASKFALVLSIAVYYNRVEYENTTDKGYENHELAVNGFGAFRFATYYLVLCLISQGYGVMSSELMWAKSFYGICFLAIFGLFSCSAAVEDRYLVVAVVIITTALFSSIFTIMWAFQMKKIMFLRVTFFNREDWETHEKAQKQLRNKLCLVMVSLVEVFAFLAFMIMFEFHHAESYPIPNFTGSLSLEIVEFLIILPLSEAYKLRDLSMFYPIPPPPPVYNVIKLPGKGYSVSMEAEGEQKRKKVVARVDRDFTVITVPAENHRTRRVRAQRQRDYRRSAMNVSDI